MANFAAGQTIAEAWLDALQWLHFNKREAFDLVVTIADPTPEHSDPAVMAALDKLLVRKKFQEVATVANTIFPTQLASTSRSREHLYSKYRFLSPRLRKLGPNRRGIYFERLIHFPLQQDSSRANQLEVIIRDLQGQVARRARGQGPLQHVYEAQVFAPGLDRLPQGFPCMSSLSFHLEGQRLRLSATYRNQYYVRKALGNFIGLAQLQRFVAQAARLDQGPLTIHAFHAQIDPEVGMRATEALIRDCRDVASPRRLRTAPA